MRGITVLGVLLGLVAFALALVSIRRYGPGGRPRFIDLWWVGLGALALGLIYGSSL